MGKNTNTMWDVLIIGAGAAGMIAGITAAASGKKVCILERQNKIGKKIYATGNGKCNFTNQNMSAEHFYGNCEFIENVIRRFSVEDCLELFHSLGVYPKEKNGYYYPNSEQASSVVDALSNALFDHGVKIYCDTQITNLSVKDSELRVSTNHGEFVSRQLIIACGLLAAPKLGSDGSLFENIKGLGHTLAPVLPTLCGYYCKGMDFKHVSGVRTHGTVSAYVNGQKVATDTGEVQFTDYGLSGIPVFQISHPLSVGLYQKQEVKIVLNLLPEFDKLRLLKELHFRKQLYHNKKISHLLDGLLNQKLADVIIDTLGCRKDMLCSELSSAKLEELIRRLCEYEFPVTKYRDYEFAQVCTGGISPDELDWSTLESKLVPNVYFAGEIIDVDGICGGYNLHFAWATGFIAGRAVSK